MKITETLENGVVVRQITDEPTPVSNIYCERPYVSPDGRRFLYAVQDGEEWNYFLCEFDSWSCMPVGRGFLAPTVSYQGDYYYARPAGSDAIEMVRIDLETGATEVRFALPGIRSNIGHPSVSADGRYLAFHRAVSFKPQRFGIFVADRCSGRCDIVYEDPFVCNAHCQFHAVRSDTLLVQHNRGCEFLNDGTRVKLIGEDDGCTLFILNIHTGEATRLQIGIPYTSQVTGHETWVGASDTIICTVRGEGRFDEARGNILTIRAGEPARQRIPSVLMNHIGTTPCGRYFHADGGEGGRIIVGSPGTGRFVDICLSHTRYTPEFGQQAHPHAYLSPDYQRVVFNSDRTGLPQTYVASIPEDLLNGLDSGNALETNPNPLEGKR